MAASEKDEAGTAPSGPEDAAVEKKEQHDVPDQDGKPASLKERVRALESRQLAKAEEQPGATRGDSASSASSSSSPAKSLSKAERRRRRDHPVWLHIYDLDPVTARLNDAVLRSAGMGAFHCGVEVLCDEWFFAWGETDCSGVLCNEPKNHQVHVYKESLSMGDSPLTEDEVKTVIGEAMDDWPANTYHPVSRSCVNFAQDFLQRLKVPEPFPDWVRGAPDTGKNPMLLPIVDFGWRWVKWYCSEGPTPEEEARRQEEASTAALAASPTPPGDAGGAGRQGY